MKIKPEIFLTNKKEISYKIILVTGSDESLISYTKSFIVNNFKKRNFFIDETGEYKEGLLGGLFSDRKTLFLFRDYPIKNDRDEDHYILITLLNGTKATKAKTDLAKLKNAAIIECYTLTRKAKEMTLGHFVKENKLTLSTDVFWYIVENFDNNYVGFIKQLQNLLFFGEELNSISAVEKITFVENNIEINKAFFNIFKTNKFLSNIFNKNINSVSDFYIFLNSTKLYMDILSTSIDLQDAQRRFPKYLFAEKDVFSKVYIKMNKEKLLKIYHNISRAEVLLRRHSELYSMIGLRFFLNLKKIIIS